MMCRLEILPKAERVLDQAFDYIAADSPSKAQTYIRELYQTAKTYQKSPDLGLNEPELSIYFGEIVQSFRHKNHRCYYVYDDRALRILTVRHTSMDDDKAF